MSDQHNTLFLRLAGPMQSGERPRACNCGEPTHIPASQEYWDCFSAPRVFRERIRSANSRSWPHSRWACVLTGAGTLDWDYHTAGAKIGIRRADGKGPKITQSRG